MLLKSLRPLLIMVLLASFFSCSEDESPEETEGSEIVDTYSYLALRNDGTLFTIGNNSGKVVEMGNIPGIEFNTMFNAVTSSGSENFIYEHRFDPPRGIIYAWEKRSGETRSAILDYPEQFGDNTALLSLDWDEENQNLVGITRENMEQSNHQKPIMVVSINPENFEITTGEIDLSTKGYENIYSTSLIRQKLYVVASKTERVTEADLLEIELDQNSVEVLPRQGIATGFTNIGNSGGTTTLFGFSPVANSSYMAEVRPVIYNIETGTVTEVSEVPRISSLNFAHKTFYNGEGKEFVELVGANNSINLLKYNPSTGDQELIKLQNADDLSSLISIIAVREL
ncbi:hypothetical protein [Autumnicola psychrophila]|uniref:Lipoprotein n=1 Tax=Autumnicola psychrophila TaxID=3075592 RepID=A0ABU3DVG6_9FLAO|nr:hypothetical protein [Zunongwangia sp. F225]MDT0687711.1 hypothetical protein [Zunongwangia sp. F225]